MNRLAICEPQCKEGSHETCNSAFVYAICSIYSKVEITLFAHETHISYLKSYWENRNISIPNLKFCKINYTDVYSDSAIDDFKKTIEIVKEYLKGENHKNIFFTSVHPLYLKLLKNSDFYCCCILHGGIEEFNDCKKKSEKTTVKQKLKNICTFVRHPKNNLKTIKGETSKNIFNKKNSYKNVLFSLSDKQFSFIVLSEHILENLRNKFNIGDNYYYVPHFQLDKNNVIHSNNNYPKFAVFGYGAGNSLFPDLAAKLKNLDKKYELRNVGMRVYNNYSNNPNFIQLGKGFLSRQEMENNIQDIDFFLNFYTPDTYKFTCSGSIVEAITYEKPVIYISNDCYNSYNKPYKFGIECKNIDEMMVVISDIINNWEKYKQSKYKDLLNNIRKKKDQISIKNNKSVLENALSIFTE